MLRKRGVGLGRDHAHRNPEMLEAVPQVVMEQAGQVLRRRAEDHLVERALVHRPVDRVERVGPAVQVIDVLLGRAPEQLERVLAGPVLRPSPAG